LDEREWTKELEGASIAKVNKKIASFMFVTEINNPSFVITTWAVK
jgi:hypothetical protein